MKYLNYLILLSVFFFSCSNNDDPILDEVSEDNLVLTATNVSNATAGNGTANYSSVQTADLPTVYSTVYYPSTDTAAGINAAINTANAAGGGTVQLSTKTYLIDEHITMKSNVRLLGNGMGNTILKRSSSFQTSDDDYFIGAHDASLVDVEVRSLTLDGDYSRSELEADPTPLIGIFYDSAEGYYNERVRVIYCEIYGFVMGIHMKGTTHITVQNSDIHDNGATYLDHNIYFRRAGHINIYKNDIYDSVGGSGLKIAGGTTTVSNESRYIIVRENDINNNERINLNIQGCHHMLIEDNELESQNSTVTAMAGMFLREYNGYECRYTDIINNSIIDNAENGVYVSGCRTFNIEGNSVNNNGTDYTILTSSDFSCDYNN